MKKYKMIDGEKHELVNYVASCSGCYETNEGHPIHESGKSTYAFDEKNRIFLGSGCAECGYKGKRRYKLYAPVLNQETSTQSPEK